MDKICISQKKVMHIVCTLLAYLLWVLVYAKYERYAEEADVFFFAWFGIICFVGYIAFWRKTVGRYFTLFNIFLCFFLVFNFGQCLLWAFNIHSEQEIGKQLLYRSIACDTCDIVRAQLVFIISFVFLNCGAFIAHPVTINKTVKVHNFSDIERKKIYYTSLILSVFVVPATISMVLKNFSIGRAFGYSYIYYGQKITLFSMGSQILGYLFLLCLLGLLIGSNFKKNIRRMVYIIFTFYVIISLLMGDRGEWIIKLIIIFFVEYTYHRKIEKKKVILLGIGGYIALTLMNAVVSLRNVGLSFEAFLQQLSKMDNNPVASLLNEFGGSMAVNVILVAKDVNFPHGNTYCMSFITAVSTQVVNEILGMNYVQLGEWFSKEYLNIKGGADFTIIGEAIINYGVYVAPFIISVLGFIIYKISFIAFSAKATLFSVCIMLSFMEFLIKLPRATSYYFFHRAFYCCIVFGVIYFFVSSVVKSSYSKIPSIK